MTFYYIYIYIFILSLWSDVAMTVSRLSLFLRCSNPILSLPIALVCIIRSAKKKSPSRRVGIPLLSRRASRNAVGRNSGSSGWPCKARRQPMAKQENFFLLLLTDTQGKRKTVINPEIARSLFYTSEL